MPVGIMKYPQRRKDTSVDTDTKTKNEQTLSSTLSEQAHAIADTIKEQGQEKVGEVTELVTNNIQSGLTQTKNRAADSLSSVAEGLHEICRKVNGKGGSPLGGYLHDSHRAVDQLSDYLRSHEVNEVVADVEDYARQRPATFVGGLFAVGFLAGRFLRSSAAYQGTRALAPYTPPNRPDTPLSPSRGGNRLPGASFEQRNQEQPSWR
jgi:ElaB/YqjD/DUF883 family membrane-anchored ribosome-binding protein